MNIKIGPSHSSWVKIMLRFRDTLFSDPEIWGKTGRDDKVLNHWWFKHIWIHPYFPIISRHITMVGWLVSYLFDELCYGQHGHVSTGTRRQKGVGWSTSYDQLLGWTSPFFMFCFMGKWSLTWEIPWNTFISNRPNPTFFEQDTSSQTVNIELTWVG